MQHDNSSVLVLELALPCNIAWPQSIMATSLHLKLIIQITELTYQDLYKCIILVVVLQKPSLLSIKALSPCLEVHSCDAREIQ